MPLFDGKDTTYPRVVTVTYEGSAFDQAIAAARNTYGERVAVVAIPTGCRLLPKRKVKK